MNPRTAPARFFLRVPETWVQFDVWRATRTGDLARLVDQRILDTPELKPQRALLLRALRELAERSERLGAVLCAAACEDLGDDGTLIASLAVFSTEGMAEPALNSVEAIAAQLPTTPRSEDPAEDWREVRLIELGAGLAVRVRGVATDSDGTRQLRTVSMQTLIPVPDSGDVLNIVLTSPLVGAVDGLLDLFDAISGTLEWAPGPSPHESPST